MPARCGRLVVWHNACPKACRIHHGPVLLTFGPQTPSYTRAPSPGCSPEHAPEARNVGALRRRELQRVCNTAPELRPLAFWHRGHACADSLRPRGLTFGRLGHSRPAPARQHSTPGVSKPVRCFESLPSSDTAAVMIESSDTYTEPPLCNLDQKLFAKDVQAHPLLLKSGLGSHGMTPALNSTNMPLIQYILFEMWKECRRTGYIERGACPGRGPGCAPAPRAKARPPLVAPGPLPRPPAAPPAPARTGTTTAPAPPPSSALSAQHETKETLSPHDSFGMKQDLWGGPPRGAWVPSAAINSAASSCFVVCCTWAAPKAQ